MRKIITILTILTLLAFTNMGFVFGKKDVKKTEKAPVPAVSAQQATKSKPATQSAKAVQPAVVAPAPQAVKSQPAANAQNAKVEVPKEVTNEIMIERLNNVLSYHTDILGSIEGMVLEKTDKGAQLIYKGTKLEQLDRDTLFMLFRNVNSQLSYKNLQRTQQQLKQLKQLRDLEKTRNAGK
ncbi:MAG: hypothetical protein HQL28_01420 [Candidatus Omnitrophica bacterium]|nr:hypothetical protein [Candidatus Omnitrophota bacterium]